MKRQSVDCKFCSWTSSNYVSLFVVILIPTFQLDELGGDVMGCTPSFAVACRLALLFFPEILTVSFRKSPCSEKNIRVEDAPCFMFLHGLQVVGREVTILATVCVL